MLKKTVLLVAYTLVVIAVSSLITTAYFHRYVLNQNAGPEPERLMAVEESAVLSSPIKEEGTIIEIMSYGCHYCALNEENVAKLEARLPAGKLIRLHFNNESGVALAQYSSLFATLTVMGIEPQYRERIYKAVLTDKLNLGQSDIRDRWLKEQGIDRDAYEKVSRSREVKDLQNYMTQVASYYKIGATPAFIVNKKWIALQDGEFSVFADELLSLLQHDRPLER